MIAKFDKRARSGTGERLKSYLENGTSNDRDRKDIRLTLLGDIDILQSTIKLGHNKGYKETYRNIVVSFNEDEVSENILHKIAQDYIEQYTKGYEEDEIVCYAEAHIPKIKYKMKYNQYKKEFEKVKRKPHIHISIALYSPKLNKKLILNSNDKRIYDINLLTRKLELEYDLQPVIRKAISSDITQVQQISKKFNKRKDIKELIDNYIYDNIYQISSYNDLKHKLEKIFDIKITRESTSNAKTKSITILYENQKIRLKGDIFHYSTFNNAKKQLLSVVNYESKSDTIDLSFIKQKKLEKLNQELEEFNRKKNIYINQQNAYARKNAKKSIEEYQFKSKQQIQNVFTNYQSKIYYEIYNKHINYNLEGFYIKHYKDETANLTIITNKNKQIRVIDRGHRITIEGNNLKEEVKISIELCLAKGWKLENIESRGSKEFMEESKKQINALANNKEKNQIKHLIIDSNSKSKTITEQKYHKLHKNLTNQDSDLSKDDENTNSEKVRNRRNFKKCN